MWRPYLEDGRVPIPLYSGVESSSSSKSSEVAAKSHQGFAITEQRLEDKWREDMGTHQDGRKGIPWTKEEDRLLKKLFFSLNLKENGKGVFSLPYITTPTIKLIGSTLFSYLKFKEDNAAVSRPEKQQNTSCGLESTKDVQLYDPNLPELENIE